MQAPTSYLGQSDQASLRSEKMARPPKAIPADVNQIHLRLSGDLLSRIDARVEAINAGGRWPKVTRSDLIRELLEKAVAEEEPTAQVEKLSAASLDMQSRLTASERAFLTEPDPKKPHGRK